MPVRLQCPQGHIWEFVHDGRSTLPISADVCPICGRSSERVSLAADAAGPGGAGTAPFHALAAEADLPTVPGYEIMAVLGRGGMGIVYRARQISLNRVVALKLPHTGPAAPTVLSDRFRAEAEVVARLHHPHIVQVHDFGIHDGRPYFSMEYLDGGSLADRVADTLVPPRPAARLVATLARAVHAAHAAGIIHRDLKPANVLLTEDGTPKIGDFGLALLLSGGTDASGIEGTPNYMAPEQAEGRADRIGPATDVYALGAILYRLLTGQPPHDGSDLVEAIEQVVARPPVPPRQLQPGVPRDLEAICLKCLEKDPSRRYSTAAALADDLDRFVAGDAVRARRSPVREKVARVLRRRPALVALGLLLVVLAASVAWYWHTHWRVTVDYYANVVTRWGVAEGVGLLTAEQVRHRGQSYRFFNRAGRVERVEIVNASGKLADRPTLSGPITTADDLALVSRFVCAFDYRRDENGQLTDEVARNAAGEVVWSFHYTDAETGHYKDRVGLPFPPVASGAAYVRFARTPDGRDREQHFLDAAGRPRPDARGVYGERREFDARGLAMQMITLGPDWQPASSPFGPAVARFRHDEQGNVTEFAYYKVDGPAATAPQNFSRVEQGYDEWGNLTRMTFFGTDGNRCLRTDGYAEFVIVPNERGERVYAECFGVDGQRIVGRDGYARLRIRYDDTSHPIEISFFDTDDRACDFVGGFAALRGRFDARGFQTRIEYLDRKNGLCMAKVGYARIDRTVSDDRQTVETRIYGPDGKPIRDASGVECWTIRYDEHDREVERRFWKSSGEPFTSTEGYAGWRKRSDERGNVIECTFLGPDGQPCQSASGVARWTAEFNDLGSETARIYYDLAGRQLREIVLVTEIVVGSRAEKLDIRVGDVILTYNGRPVASVKDYQTVVKAGPLDGQKRELVVRRNGSDVTFSLPPGIIGMRYSNHWVPK